MASFAADVDRAIRKFEAKQDLAVRKIVLELLSSVVLGTPVDTGRARGNWQVQIGTIPSGTLEVDDKAGTVTIAEADSTLTGIQSGDVIYIVNNLPYIKRLEDGYSNQAPAGMVNLTVQRFNAIVGQVAKEIQLV